MSENGKTKCAVKYCREDAVEGSFVIKTSRGACRVTPSKTLMEKPLCQKHLLELLEGEELDGLPRIPGSGVRFLRKAFCKIRRQSVSADECFRCFGSGEGPKRIPHLLCQDANLQPSPLDKRDDLED